MTKKQYNFLKLFTTFLLISNFINISYSNNYKKYDYDLPNEQILIFDNDRDHFEKIKQPQEANNLIDAMANGEVKLLFRLRHESANDKNPVYRTGMLTSLKSQIHYSTAKFIDSRFFFEVTNLSNFFIGRYNSGISGIGKPGFTPIQELQGTGVTTAYLEYNGFPCSQIHYGRQKIKLDNQRHVGIENFRQYPKNFDGITIKTKSILPEMDLFYAFLSRMNTNLAAKCNLGQNKLRTHLFNISWQFMCAHKLIFYAYLNRDKTIPINSNATYGFRIKGKERINPNTNFKYVGEYAYQTGSFNNPSNYYANYFMGEIGIKHKLFYPRIGFESLGGNANKMNSQFKTPLASNHNFQGWYNYTIPNRGVRDFYAKADASIYCYCLGLAYHSFHYQAGGNASFANEIDIKISREIEPGIDLSIMYAKFNAKRDFNSGNKIWLSLCAKFG